MWLAAESVWFKGDRGENGLLPFVSRRCSTIPAINSTRDSKLRDTNTARSSMSLAEITHDEESHRSSSPSHADELQGPGYIWIQPQQ